MEGDEGVGAQVPALEHGGVGQLDEQDVDEAHGAQEEGLDGDGEPEEDGDGEVGEHAGEEDVVGQEAEAVAAGGLVAAPLPQRRRCACRLALTGELIKKKNVE